MASDEIEDRTARELLKFLGTGQQSAAISVADMAAARRIADLIRSLREARGERVVGRKIGFSNRLIWARYGVDRPMWNYVWDTTLVPATDPDIQMKLAGFPEPRIEPEVVLHLARAPEPGMDEEALLACIDRVAHGFEIVQSVFPGWKFTAAGSAAAFGLHGALVVGPWLDLGRNLDAWGVRLKDFTVKLHKNGALVEVGHARNVLGGPLTALRYLVETIAAEPQGVPLRAGELVTTGTLTDAYPATPGEVWSTEFEGIDLMGLKLQLLLAGFRLWTACRLLLGKNRKEDPWKDLLPFSYCRHFRFLRAAAGVNDRSRVGRSTRRMTALGRSFLLYLNPPKSDSWPRHSSAGLLRTHILDGLAAFGRRTSQPGD